MKTRKRREGEHAGNISRKKAKLEEDVMGKFMSLVEAGDTIAGLTYFLTTVLREDNSSSSLIGAYLLQYPSCEHVLSPLQWERDKQTYNTMLLCLECLENILLYTASLEALSQSDTGSGMGLSPGHKLVGTILRDHMRPIYSSLMTSCPMKLVAACLRLLTAMVLQGHHSARDVQQNFNFTYKSLVVFPNRTNRVKGYSDSVRTYFIKFALSFLITGDNDVIRNILELKRFLSSVFKLLLEDPVEIVHLFLSTLQQKVLRNSGVSKRAKSSLFNHYVLKQLSSLLSPPSPGPSGEGEGEEGEGFEVVSQEGGEVVSLTLHQYVLEVLTELCTSFQYGVCYRTKIDTLLAERSNNPAILQLLLSLTSSLSDHSVQSLITRAITTCPDLLTPYLQSVTLSFEPRPSSKWMENVDFLTSLMSGLPPVVEILGVSGCGQDSLVSLVPAAVGLTVPRPITRAMLNQGVQHATPLVKLKTLQLVEVILKRSTDTVSSLKGCESSTCTGPITVSMMYTDAVLKLLPELKTLINLRQQLTVRVRLTVELVKSDSSSLSHEQRICNAALLEDSTLLTQCLAIMRGYQLLSPSLFLQADFNPAKLLPSLSDLQQASNPPHPSVVMATLRLLEEAPDDYFNWQQRRNSVLSSLLWLVVCGDGETSDTALKLTLKLLLSVDALSSHTVELGVMLAAARRFSRVCLSERGGGGRDRGVATVDTGTTKRKRDEGGDRGVVMEDGEKPRREEEEEEVGDEGRRRKTKRRRKSCLLGVDSVSGEGGCDGDGGEEGDGGGRRGDSYADREGEEGDGVCFVKSLVEMFSILAKQPHQFATPHTRSDAAVNSCYGQLDNILAGPLEIPTVSEVVCCLGEDTSRQECSSTHDCLLLPAVVSSIDCNKYFPFVCDVIIRLLLAQDSYQTSQSTACHLLTLSDQWQSRSWCSLYQSLVSLLHYWAGDTATNAEVEVEGMEINHVSSRKCVKKLMKSTPVGTRVLELLSGMTREHLLECAVATATRQDLYQAVLYYFDLRPLYLFDCCDNPALQDLLLSLPPSTLALQSIQLEPSINVPPSSPPLISLSRALSTLPLQLWQGSLLASDVVSVMCTARMMLAVILELHTANDVSFSSAVSACFDVLELLLLTTKTTSTCSDNTHSKDSHQPSILSSSDTLLLHTTVFNSPLVNSLLPHTTSDVNCSSVATRGRGVRSECIGGLSRLLSTALQCREEFKRSSCFSSVFQRLLDRVVSAGGEIEDDDIGVSLIGLVKAVRLYLDSTSLLDASERLLRSLTTSSPPPHHQSLISQALLTLLTPHSSPEGGAPTNCDTNEIIATKILTVLPTCTKLDRDNPVNYPTNEVTPTVSVCGLQQLLEAALVCDLLARPALDQVCRRLSVSPASISLDTWAVLDRESRGPKLVTSGHHFGHGSEEEEFLKQLGLLSKRIAVKGLCPSFLVRVHKRFSNSPCENSDSWLPDELLYQLLDTCVGSETGVARCSLIGCLLLHMPHRTLEHFTGSCIQTLCDHVASSALSVREGEGEEGEGEEREGEREEGVLATALFLVAMYLTAIMETRGMQKGCEGWNEDVKMVRKLVWKACTTLIVTISHHQHYTIIQGLCVRVLCLLCQLSSRARKKLRTLAESWVTASTSWTRPQVQVVGMAGRIGEGDSLLCGMAVGRLLRRVVHASSDGVGGNEGEGKEEEEEMLRDEDVPLLRDVWGVLHNVGTKDMSLDVRPVDWNMFVEQSMRGVEMTSSVLGCLCAGVKVMYGEGGEEGRRERGEELMSLKSICSMLWSHTKFRDVLFSSLPAKESLVEVLVCVTERCPTACATSHVPTLLGAYSASRTRADRGLLYLLLLYEINGANIGKFKPYLWGEAGRKAETERREVGWLQWQTPGARQVLDSLDSHRMRLSLDHFPQHTPLEPVNPFTTAETSSGRVEEEESVYDPAFILPLLSHLLEPSGLVECRVVVGSGALSYLLTALSSHVTEVRMATAHCLSRFHTNLRTSTCREKPQLSLLMRIVKNTLEEQPQRLPSLHTAFCAQVARIFLQPELPLYVVVGHYLVHKPVLEVRDIPLFNTLIHSTSAQHCSERSWLLGVLLSGLQSEADYRLYQRKRILPHLISLYTAPCMDDKARGLILELLLRACSHPVAVSDLVWNHGLLAWLTLIKSSGDVLRKIVSVVSASGMGGGKGSGKEGGEGAVRLPPLLEEELSLTASRAIV